MEDQSWSQTRIVGEPVIEINIRLGIVPEADHAQALVECTEPESRALLAMWSRPHQRLGELHLLIADAARQALAFAHEHADPF